MRNLKAVVLGFLTRLRALGVRALSFKVLDGRL